MFVDVMDSIPGIGHAKGMFHYITGDIKAAKRSMHEATRSTAVIAGGVVGAFVGGPVGAIAGAVSAGAAVDTVTTVVTQKPHGFISGVSDIATEISNGNVPIASVVRTGLIIGSDVVGGLVPPTNVVIKLTTKSTIIKSLGEVFKQIIKSEVVTLNWSRFVYGYTRLAVDTCEEMSKHDDSMWSPRRSKTTSSTSGRSSRQSSNTNASKKSEESKPSSAGGSGSDGQPPNNNPNNYNKKEDIETHWEVFLRIFNKKTLEEIIIVGRINLKDINRWQKKELKDFIVKISKTEYLDLAEIVNIAITLLSEIGGVYATFHNFLNIAKFVEAYLHDQLAFRNDLYNENPPDYPYLSKNYVIRRKQLARIISSEITNSNDVLNLFKNFMAEITNLMKSIHPRFVNVIAGIYHYYKHKFVSVKIKMLTTVEYFTIIREVLARLKTIPQFKNLVTHGTTRIVYEKYYADIGRRLIMVLKLQVMEKRKPRVSYTARLNEWNLSSCYFMDDAVEGDEDGDEWLNDEKLPREWAIIYWLKKFFKQ